VLALVGVEPALIVADYAASAEGLQPLFTQWLAAVAHDEAQHAALALQLTAHPETMLAVLAALDTRYGGIDAYLAQCGVGEAKRSAVRQRLCQEPSEYPLLP
jgi:protein-tyrosine phosphatase